MFYLICSLSLAVLLSQHNKVYAVEVVPEKVDFEAKSGKGLYGIYWDDILYLPLSKIA